MEPQKLDNDGRWWRVAGHEVDLQAESHTGQPMIARAVCLAFRDKVTPEDEDVYALLLWTLEEHPPWSGQCATCHGPCPDLQRGELVAVEWLNKQMIARAQQVMSPEWQARLRALETKQHREAS